MKWIGGLKEFNKNEEYKSWVAPKRGTKAYQTVM